MAERIKARKADLDPVRELPYRPAAKTLLTEAGQMAASDYALTSIYRLRFKGHPQMPLKADGKITMGAEMIGRSV